MAKLKELPLPPHFNGANSRNADYQPDIPKLLELAEDWRKKHNVSPVGQSKVNIQVLGIDNQKDICL